ncbi:unnamed protein product [Cunninghamella echinulata]
MKYPILLSVLSLSSIVSSELTRIDLRYRAYSDNPIYREPLFEDDGTYFGNINIGGQTVTVTFDSSTPVNWVPSSKCSTNACDLAPKKYDASKSSTSTNTKKPFKVVYDDGCIDGTLYRDKISVGGYDLKETTFVNADSVTGDLGTNRYLGSLGVGGYADGDWYDRSNNELNLFLNATLDLGLQTEKKAPKLKARDIVGMPGWGRSRPPRRGRKLRKRWYDSYLVIGGIDQSFVEGDFVQLDLPTCDYGESRYWKTSLQSIRLGDTYETKTDSEKTLAQFHTGSNFILAPEEKVKCLHEAIGATLTIQSNHEKVYQLPCDQIDDLPPLEFQLNNDIKASIPSTAWLTPDQNDSTKCNSLIRSVNGDKSAAWSLGNAFLDEFYVYFDYDKATIQLAKSSGGDGEVGSWN